MQILRPQTEEEHGDAVDGWKSDAKTKAGVEARVQGLLEVVEEGGQGETPWWAEEDRTEG